MSSTERDITAQGFSLLQILVEVTVIVPHRPPTISLPHWVISNASTTTYAPLEAGFCWPVTSIVRVWPVAARLVALKTTAWTCSVGEYVSTSATRTPSRNTRAIPVWGPRFPIPATAVPVKANAACPPAVVETTAVPPLHALGSA